MSTSREEERNGVAMERVVMSGLRKDETDTRFGGRIV
jgi:hypothetical protein